MQLIIVIIVSVECLLVQIVHASCSSIVVEVLR
jgi:hypothetical protein